MQATGYDIVSAAKKKTVLGRFAAFRDRYRVHTSATLAVLAALTFIAAETFPAVQQFVSTSDLLQYVTLIIVLDLAASVYFQQQSPTRRVVKNQEESMTTLIEAVPHCRRDGADLLEYAGQTTMPLIREIERAGVPMRMLVKHPETLTGPQKSRSITALDTLYNSVFDRSDTAFEVRCYRLPFALRGRRLGKAVLELGWLTPDLQGQTAYGHANPSLIADLSTSSNDHLRAFFDRTFNDLWKDKGTEHGREVFRRLLLSDQIERGE